MVRLFSVLLRSAAAAPPGAVIPVRRRPWRNAASSILVARNALADATEISKDDDSNTSFDYRVLMLRRSSKSAFMPNAYVFPGGVVAKSDFSREWIQLFDQFGNRSIDELVDKNHEGDDKPLILKERLEGEPERGLPREVAFRLCAIRETFEESGVLFSSCKNGEVSEVDPQLLHSYRDRVHKDPAQLLQLCREAGVAPDVWAMHEFADWLTPLGRKDKGGRRFDTIFYVAFLEGPDRLATMDSVEVTDALWTDPDRIAEEAKEGSLWLAPPQVYELRRLSRGPRRFEDLRRACEGRSAQISTWLPVLLNLTGSECTVSIYPGDELYPQDPDLEGSRPPLAPMDLTEEELNAKYPRMNRMFLYSANDVRTFVSSEVEEELALK